MPPNIYAYRTRAVAGIGIACGLGASPTPDLRGSAKNISFAKELTMAGSKPVGRCTLLKKELKFIFDEGLLLSSYNIYSQFTPWQQMETFVLELVALEIAYHAGGLSKYEITKKWTVDRAHLGR
jgi:hypothetical protein